MRAETEELETFRSTTATQCVSWMFYRTVPRATMAHKPRHSAVGGQVDPARSACIADTAAKPIGKVYSNRM